MRDRWSAEDEALIADLEAVIRKHGLEAGNLTRETAEYVVLCLEANAHLAYYRVKRMLGDKA